MVINPPSLGPKKSKMSSLIIMLGVAICFGLFAAIGIWQYLLQTQEKVKELSATRAVVVASKKIPAGTKLKEEFLAIKQLPAQAVPKDYPSSINSLTGRIVKSTIEQDEIISETRLIGKGAEGGLTLVIPPGQRAITIKVNEVVGVGGFINPGNRVDIVTIVKQNENNFSKTILQNVLVLAVGEQILDPNALSDPKPKIVGQVTVALTIQDSEKLALAHEIGQIHLVLRPHGEDKTTSTDGSTLADVYGGFLPFGGEQGMPPMPVSQADFKNSIEVILGNRKTYYFY